MRVPLPTINHPRPQLAHEEFPGLWRQVLLCEALLVGAFALPFAFAVFVPYGRLLPFLALVPPWFVAPYAFATLAALGLLVASVRASAMQRCLIASFIFGIIFWLVISIASWQ
jgi:hypothetical protein